MNKLKLKGLSLTNIDYLSKVIALSEEDLINTDLPDLLKMVGFLYGVKLSSQQTVVSIDTIDEKIKAILDATKVKNDVEFGIDLSTFNIANLHLSLAVKNKYTLAPTANLQQLVSRYPDLWSHIKLDLPNALPESLATIVNDGFVIVDSKIVSKLKETILNLEHLEEVK
jgi:hypothetical protein